MRHHVTFIRHQHLIKIGIVLILLENEMSETILTSKQQKLSAQIFNIASIVSVLIPPLILLWIAASIFTYAAVAHHPNPRVREFLRPAGFRFYGLVGSLVVVLNFSGLMKQWMGSASSVWLTVWVVSFLVIVPLGVRDILRASREDWSDMQVAEIRG
jgi:hypothetical protein